MRRAAGLVRRPRPQAVSPSLVVATAPSPERYARNQIVVQMTCDPNIATITPGDPERHGEHSSDDQRDRDSCGVPDEDRPGLTLDPEPD